MSVLSTNYALAAEERDAPPAPGSRPGRGARPVQQDFRPTN